MSRITNIRKSRESARNRRAINRALDAASTPALRDEIILMAQRQGFGYSR